MIGCPDMHDQIIPARVVISITSYCNLNVQTAFSRVIQSTIAAVRQIVTYLQSTAPLLSLLSTLTQSADRVFVREALKCSGSLSEVILARGQDEYVQTFQMPESRVEFEEPLS